MTTSSILHTPAPYAAAAALVAAVVIGSSSLSGSDEPTVIQAPSYGSYAPGGHHPVSHRHHVPTTSGGRVMIGD
jgi:hypothetical protein